MSYKEVFQKARSLGYQPTLNHTIENWERVVAVDPKFQYKLDKNVLMEYSLVMDWLEREHRVVLTRIGRTSGGHQWGIWEWNGKLWQEVSGRWDELEQVLMVALNKKEVKDGL